MDRAFLRFVITLLAVLAALGICNSANAAPEVIGGIVPGDYCNAGARVPWTREAKRRTRQRAARACSELEAAPIVCAYVDAVICRESFCGEASIRHTLGEGEQGLGPMGLSTHWHRDKWPGADEDPAFCTVEASELVALDIMRRAVTRYGATSIATVQAVYGGHTRCWSRPGLSWLSDVPGLRWLAHRFPARRECEPVLTEPATSGICSRMRARGFSCWARVNASDLGREIPVEARRAWAISGAA